MVHGESLEAWVGLGGEEEGGRVEERSDHPSVPKVQSSDVRTSLSALLIEYFLQIRPLGKINTISGSSMKLFSDLMSRFDAIRDGADVVCAQHISAFRRSIGSAPGSMALTSDS